MIMFDLGTTFLAAVERSPERVAVVDGGLRLTYAQWLENIRADGFSSAQHRNPATTGGAI